MYLLLYGLSRIVSLPVLYRFADVLWPISVAVNRESRRVLYANVSGAFPHYTPSEVSRTVHKIFLNFGYSLAEFFVLSSRIRYEWKTRVELIGVEHLDQAREKGKGVLVVSGHIGNWELGAAVVAALGYPIHAVFYPQPHPGTDKIFRRLRAKEGIHSYPLAHALWPITRALARNELVCVAGDRLFRGQAMTAEYFGRPATVPAGPARLAARTGTPVVPSVMLRKRRGLFSLQFGPPIWPDHGDEESKAREIVKHYLSFLEKHVMEEPEQWCNFGRQWAEDGERESDGVNPE